MIWRETMTRLGVHRARIKECKGAFEASEFSRWLQFSGIIKLLEDHPYGEPLPVDGPGLRKAAQDLAYDAGQLLKQGKGHSDVSEWELVNKRLAAIENKLGLSSDVVAPTPVVVLHRLEYDGQSESGAGRAPARTAPSLAIK